LGPWAFVPYAGGGRKGERPMASAPIVMQETGASQVWWSVERNRPPKSRSAPEIRTILNGTKRWHPKNHCPPERSEAQPNAVEEPACTSDAGPFWDLLARTPTHTGSHQVHPQPSRRHPRVRRSGRMKCDAQPQHHVHQHVNDDYRPAPT